MEKILGRIHSMESFGSVDGPGVRFVIFMQGCNMRCKYCHNPESWAKSGGELWSAEDLFEKAWRYRNYWGRDGGITVCGGEPLLQVEFLIDFFQKCKLNGVHTAIDTAGQPFSMEEEWLTQFDQLMALTDLFLLDIKETDAIKHKALTGHTNENILQMAEYLSDHGKAMWIRHVLVPGLTDDPKKLERLREFAQSLKTVQKVEILPYHTMGKMKYDKLGIQYPLEGIAEPTREQIDRANQILHEK